MSHILYIPVSIRIFVVIKFWIQFPPEDIDRHPEVVSQHVVKPEGRDEEDVARLKLHLVSLGFEKPADAVAN